MVVAVDWIWRGYGHGEAGYEDAWFGGLVPRGGRKLS